ncbi:jg722 [Pararge aegeria aegeria]|uniref:Jg722 protein n=1 Tax=Pararge aegeria aegeria TaxID=348720 RepID=A0A8S4QXU5_9NEOP|nr:jg722 [Pararge aegeria aegeria]
MRVAGDVLNATYHRNEELRVTDLRYRESGGAPIVPGTPLSEFGDLDKVPLWKVCLGRRGWLGCGRLRRCSLDPVTRRRVGTSMGFSGDYHTPLRDRCSTISAGDAYPSVKKNNICSLAIESRFRGWKYSNIGVKLILSALH